MLSFHANQPINSCTLTTDKHLDEIFWLRQSSNSILYLQINAFRNLSQLTELDVSYNKLTSRFHSDLSSCFPHDAICDLKNLIVLRISSNHLPEIFESEWSAVALVENDAFAVLEKKKKNLPACERCAN